jgi:hypothetical protein
MGECDIDGGPRFANGSLILEKSAMRLCLRLVRLDDPGNATSWTGFLNLNTFDHSGNPPPPPHAAFKKWTVTCELFEGLDPPFVLRGPPLEPRPKVPWDAFGGTGLDERTSPARP